MLKPAAQEPQLSELWRRARPGRQRVSSWRRWIATGTVAGVGSRPRAALTVGRQIPLEHGGKRLAVETPSGASLFPRRPPFVLLTPARGPGSPLVPRRPGDQNSPADQHLPRFVGMTDWGRVC